MKMCRPKFGDLVLRTILIFVAAQYVLSEKTSYDSDKENLDSEFSVDMILDNLEREISNETFSEIFNLWDNEEDRGAKSLQGE